MTISIGNDHAGTLYKQAIKNYLESHGHTVIDHGTNSEDSVDYPDYAHPVASDVSLKKVDLGILVCGSGNGVNMVANKYQNVRAALCWNNELSALARQHNNANIASIPGRFTSIPQAVSIVKTFLNTAFEGGRHDTRVKKIPLSSQ